MVGTDSCTRRISPLKKIDSSAPVLVAYKVDDSYVYLVNANGNSSSAPIPLDVWRTASWVKEAYLYSESVITE